MGVSKFRSVNKCVSCPIPVPELSPQVVNGALRYHLGCYNKMIEGVVREKVAAEQRQSAIDALAAQALQASLLSAQQAEDAKIKKAAEETVAKETARIATLTLQATEALRKQATGSGPAMDRFALIEMDEPVSETAPSEALQTAGNAPQSVAAEAPSLPSTPLPLDAPSAPSAPQAAYKQAPMTDDEWRAAGSPCIRCKAKGPHGEYHPKHCSPCWMSRAPQHLGAANASDVGTLDKLPEIASASLSYFD